MKIQGKAKILFGSIRKVSPLIFAGAAILGVGATAYLAVRESKDSYLIQEKIKEVLKREEPAPKKEIARMRINMVMAYRWAILCGVGTVGCIFASTAISWIRLKHTTDALIATEKIYEKYKKAVLATGASSIAIGEEMAKDSQNDIPVATSEDDNKILIYDASNDNWFRSTETDVYRAIIYLNETIDSYGTATVKDFYKFMDLDAPLGSDVRGWYVWSDEWFSYHDGQTTLRFSMEDGHKTDDGTEYWLFMFYDDPMYHTELGASMDQCIEERRTLFHMSEEELDEYRSHDA